MILIVDDEAENRSSLVAVLEREGWICIEADSGLDALAILRSKPEIELLITDLKMPGMDGLELLQSARLLRPEVQRLLVTAFGTIEDTVTAMKSGAFDVLPKPLKSKTIRETVSRLLARAPKSPENTNAKAAFPLNSQLSPSYAQVLETLRRAAATQANVLFTGESGTGKSYLARVLHQSSERKEGPFVVLNCASIPMELLESELFGYERGAFTGATQSRDGKIFAANRGTLLLDEIGDLSHALQAKLLHFIQERKFFKLGSNREITADVRILAATNQSLPELVRSGKFREDLLYRLRVVEIPVPPLRERRQDLFWLVPALLDSLAEKNRISPVRLTHDAFSLVWSYDWPGNVRELENVLESSLVLAPPEELREGFLSSKALEGRIASEGSNAEKFPHISDLATLERQAIRQALALTGGNRRMTARLLGISERTLYRVVQKGQREDKREDRRQEIGDSDSGSDLG
jgi:two-component system response regulator HydG